MKTPLTTNLINVKLHKYFVFFRKNKGLQFLLLISQITLVPEIYNLTSWFSYTNFFNLPKYKLNLPAPLPPLTKPTKRKLTPLKRYLSRYVKSRPVTKRLTSPTLLSILSWKYWLIMGRPLRVHDKVISRWRLNWTRFTVSKKNFFLETLKIKLRVLLNKKPKSSSPKHVNQKAPLGLFSKKPNSFSTKKKKFNFNPRYGCLMILRKLLIKRRQRQIWVKKVLFSKSTTTRKVLRNSSFQLLTLHLKKKWLDRIPSIRPSKYQFDRFVVTKRPLLLHKLRKRRSLWQRTFRKNFTVTRFPYKTWIGKKPLTTRIITKKSALHRQHKFQRWVRTKRNKRRISRYGLIIRLKGKDEDDKTKLKKVLPRSTRLKAKTSTLRARVLAKKLKLYQPRWLLPKGRFAINRTKRQNVHKKILTKGLLMLTRPKSASIFFYRFIKPTLLSTLKLTSYFTYRRQLAKLFLRRGTKFFSLPVTFRFIQLRLGYRMLKNRKAIRKNRKTVKKDSKLKAKKGSELKVTKKSELKAKKGSELKVTKKSELKVTKRLKLKSTKRPKLKATKRSELKATKRPELKATKRPELKATKRSELKGRMYFKIKSKLNKTLKLNSLLTVQKKTSLKKNSDWNAKTDFQVKIDSKKKKVLKVALHRRRTFLFRHRVVSNFSTFRNSLFYRVRKKLLKKTLNSGYAEVHHPKLIKKSPIFRLIPLARTDWKIITARRLVPLYLRKMYKKKGKRSRRRYFNVLPYRRIRHTRHILPTKIPPFSYKLISTKRRYGYLSPRINFLRIFRKLKKYLTLPFWRPNRKLPLWRTKRRKRIKFFQTNYTKFMVGIRRHSSWGRLPRLHRIKKKIKKGQRKDFLRRSLSYGIVNTFFKNVKIGHNKIKSVFQVLLSSPRVNFLYLNPLKFNLTEAVKGLSSLIPTPTTFTPQPRYFLESEYGLGFLMPLHGYFYLTPPSKSFSLGKWLSFKVKNYSFTSFYDIKAFFLKKYSRSFKTPKLLLPYKRRRSHNYFWSSYQTSNFSQFRQDSSSSYTSELRLKVGVRGHSSPAIDPQIRRIRFKPGYSKIWRAARTSLKFSLNLNFLYQHQLTKFLVKFFKFAKINLMQYHELRIMNILLYSRLAPDLTSAKELVLGSLVFINGSLCLNQNLILLKNDLFQLLVSFKYYILTKWLLAWVKKKKNVCRSLPSEIT